MLTEQIHFDDHPVTPPPRRKRFTHPILYDILCEDYNNKGQRTNSLKKRSYILEVEGAQNPYATVRNRKQHYADSTPGLRKCTLTGYATLRNPTQRLRRSNILFFPEYAGNFCVLPTQLYATLRKSRCESTLRPFRGREKSRNAT